MAAQGWLCHDDPVTDRFHIRRVPRSKDRVLVGVAGGYADRWSVEPTVLRAAVGLLTLVGGVGLVLYGIAVACSSAPVAREDVRPPQPTLGNRHLSIAAFTAAVLLAARSIGLWPGDQIMAPATAVAVGTSLAWTFGPSTGLIENRTRVHTVLVRSVQVIAGLALLVAGVLSLADRTGGLASVGASASAIAVVVGGLALFAAPAGGRLLRALDDERSMRIREDERAALAAHLHDSVLQSLVLMQRSEDPRRMVSLARRQERELRAWLYGAQRIGESTTLHAAIEVLTAEIEDEYDIRIETVIVGDQPLDDVSRSLVAAIREALVNAAHHAGVDRVDVFIEADDTELTGFVRDAGRGFDRASVSADRRGISESIVGRVQRAGGTAVVTSEVEVGTEVEIRLPRTSRGSRP
ncbi:MAG: ATP-binding protein [Ilumatobacteraceae bacterium]|nr:ATP-binding protein [Ilumatobacteraceae bacterium]